MRSRMEHTWLETAYFSRLQSSPDLAAGIWLDYSKGDRDTPYTTELYLIQLLKYRLTLYRITSFLAAICTFDSICCPKLRLDKSSLVASRRLSVNGTNTPRKVYRCIRLRFLENKHAWILVPLNVTRLASPQSKDCLKGHIQASNHCLSTRHDNIPSGVCACQVPVCNGAVICIRQRSGTSKSFICSRKRTPNGGNIK